MRGEEAWVKAYAAIIITLGVVTSPYTLTRAAYRSVKAKALEFEHKNPKAFNATVMLGMGTVMVGGATALMAHRFSEDYSTNESL